MKRCQCWLYLWLFVATLAHAQTEVDTVSLRANAKLSNLNWRFRAGHNPAWASPTLDDRAWAEEKLDNSNRENGALWRAGEGWFRLAFVPAKRAVGQNTAVYIQQFGQSDIYLDGRRIATLKPPKIDSGGSQRLSTLLPLRFADQKRHVLAVRYRFRKEPTLCAETGRPPLRVQFGLAEEVIHEAAYQTRLDTIVEAFSGGVYAILSMLLFLFYRSNRSKKVHEMLGYAMLLLALGNCMGGFTGSVGSLTVLSVLDVLESLFELGGYTLFLASVYRYLQHRYDWLFYIAAGGLLLDVLYGLFVGPLPDWASFLSFVLFLAGYVRVSWLGKRLGTDDARLPWRALRVAFLAVLSFIPIILLSVLLVFTFVKLGMGLPDVQGPIMAIGYVIVLVAMLSLPVGLSLSLVRDYAQTHQILGQKLTEVEALSAQTLAQEQEKQQLLARQNEQLEEQVRSRTAALNQSLADLKATQDQLVQREKLASLGQLTAGVAHEIQNPLNFVTNFSEVSAELIEEVNAERAKPPTTRDEQLTDELLADLAGNVDKIKHHGQRAANIVRSMLQHSRASGGQRDLTDLNALADQSLQLAYHGLRSAGLLSDTKGTPITLVTDFDPHLPPVPVIAQDMGRVLVNLVNNALYAVQEQQQRAGEANYQPTVTVRSRQREESVELLVEDNGTGMPDEVAAKLFQPFFTTKPTGKGTGLGLSLSYDIVAKGHGGTLTVETEAGRFTRFLLTLPKTPVLA